MIVTQDVAGYLAGLRPPSDPVLAEMEAHGERDGIPIVVPEAGALLGVLVAVRGAGKAVEVGTAIGVSTLYIARALRPGGSVVSFEIDEERHRHARDYLGRAGLSDRVDLRLQDAREGLTSLEEQSYDFAFIDGVKGQYPGYYDLLVPLLAEGGVLAVDNVLMSGTVASGRSDGHWTDEQIAGMREFTRRLLHDERLQATVLPVGDGVLVAVRR